MNLHESTFAVVAFAAAFAVACGVAFAVVFTVASVCRSSFVCYRLIISRTTREGMNGCTRLTARSVKPGSRGDCPARREFAASMDEFMVEVE